MAVPYWLRRVTKANPRVDNDWDMIGIDQAALNGCKEAQAHTDCSLVIRESHLLLSYK